MRLAVIDCGTNTFNLIIVEISSGSELVKLFNTRIPVKLGEASGTDGTIAKAPLNRALAAFASFTGYLQDYKADKVVAFATAAIREASNGQEFTTHIKDLYGITIKVIDGNREAELIYLGVRGAVKLTESVSLIMDIGGGSTEFLLANKDNIFWKKSFKLGAARLLERFKPSDPITDDEIKAMKNYLDEELAPLFEAVKIHQPIELVGSSGAFESLVEMIHGEIGGMGYTDNQTEFKVSLSHQKQIYELVVRSTLARRKTIIGLVPMRRDMIVIFCIMVDFIIRTFNFTSLRVSTYSLKEGAVSDFISKNDLT